MARLSTVTVARSDGRAQYFSNGRLLPNEPQRQDSTPAPDGSLDCYVRLAEDDPTALDWKRKLGGMLMEAVGGPQHAGKTFILSEFPHDYVLWQHRRIKARNDRTSPEVARQDTYLYGNPNGKTRFRSAQEFFPHLLWLAADPEGDSYLNCSCKYCFPESVADTSSEPTTKATPTVASSAKTVEGPENAKSGARQATSIPRPSSTNSASTPRAQPSQMPDTRTAEQIFDSDPKNEFIYRPGELVWFNKGAAWGLSIVTKRQVRDGKHLFLLQPLSYPSNNLPSVVKDRSAMRPWLAWSVPNTTLTQINDFAYDEVPWDRVVRGDFSQDGRGSDPDVDASILAARGVNESYSLFDRVDVPTAPAEVHFKGMFLGGEKLWTGEPVRLTGAKDDIVIMIIHQMVERVVDGKSSVTLVGDVYKLVKMPTPQQYTNRSNWPVNEDLPARVNADLVFRNEVAARAGKPTWREWRLLEPMARKGLAGIRGRWYETRYIMPTLRGEEAFAADLQAGEASDSSLFMNSRIDLLSRPAQRKKNRMATLGRAVPTNVKISRGYDGPPEDRAF